MNDEIDGALVRVRADTGAFARDIAAMKVELEGTFGSAADRAGLRLESALVRAVRAGKFGFDDLKRVALGALEDVAAAALRTGIASVGGKGGGGLGSLLGSLVGGLLGLPGRATGGPVAPGRAYLVGERGPEVFVPTASGRVETSEFFGAPSGPREVRLTVNINAPSGGEARALEQSARQVARAARAALMRVD